MISSWFSPFPAGDQCVGSAQRGAFQFLQEYFDLFCSDLSSFPVSRAVAASSAVPVLFSPVVVENHSGCMTRKPVWYTEARQKAVNNFELDLALEGLAAYFDKDQEKYAYLVDGGITDNLGVRALYEIVEFSGGAKAFAERIDQTIPRRIVLIVVNASTKPQYGMSASNELPSLEETPSMPLRMCSCIATMQQPLSWRSNSWSAGRRNCRLHSDQSHPIS